MHMETTQELCMLFGANLRGSTLQNSSFMATYFLCHKSSQWKEKDIADEIKMISLVTFYYGHLHYISSGNTLDAV